MPTPPGLRARWVDAATFETQAVLPLCRACFRLTLTSPADAELVADALERSLALRLAEARDE
jgi:hypothetical protein